MKDGDPDATRVPDRYIPPGLCIGTSNLLEMPLRWAVDTSARSHFCVHEQSEPGLMGRIGHR